MPPLLDSDQSSSSTTVSPSFSSFQFSTIGKEPDLLKRISAPEPNQDYQDDSTPFPSPSHSPALEHSQVTSSKLSLFQMLTNGNDSETNTVSQTIGNAPKTSSAFDPGYAALFSANVRRVQPLSILAMERRPRSPSDMDMSSAGTTPRIARSLSLTQPAPTDGAVGLITDNTRFTSVDLLNGLELAYPATECRLSASQEPLDSDSRLSMDADTTPDQRFFTRLANLIAYLESKSLQQSKVLVAIASLERDFQLVASQTSLALQNANRAEAAAEKSLSIAKDAVAVAQQSVAAANVVNTGVENALAALTHLRQCYADEHAANEHDRANLLCKMTSLKRDMVSSPSQASSCNTDADPPGLGSDLLHILSTEAMKLVRERDPGAKKRKRKSDKMDPSSTCDLTSRPSKEARHEHPTLFCDRTVESEAEAAREAWIQEAERRSAVPPDSAQRTAHEQTEKEATTRGREEDNHGQAARSGSTQGQLVNEDVDMSSDKLDAPLVEGSEENSEESLEMRARWEREVVEHKLEIARFQMQERELQEKKDKQKEVDGMAMTVGEQTEKSAPLRTRPPPTFVPATTTGAKTLERNAQQTAQLKPGLSDSSRMKVVKRLALEKQKASPATGQGSSLAPSAAQTISQPNVLQEAPRSVADTGRSDFQGQGQTRNDGVAGKEQEQGEKGREIEDRVTGAKPRGRGTPITRGSVDAKDASKLSIGNVTAQKTLVAPKTATSPQRGKTSVPQNSASMTTANVPISPDLLLHPLNPWFPALPLNDLPSQPLQPRNKDTRQASLPPIACIAEPDQAESNNAIKRPSSSRTPPKRKQGAKKAAKPRQNASNIQGLNAQPSSTEPDPRKKDTASNAPAVPPLTLASSDGFPKSEVISPTLPSFDQRTPAHEAQNPPSSFAVQPVTTAPQQNEHIDSSAPMSVPQPSHQVSSGSEPPSETVERGLRVELTNALQPLPVNGQVVAAAERVSKPPSKTTLGSPGQTGNASAFLKTPHGGHREIFGSAASSKPPSRSGLVDHNVSGKAPLPTNDQEVVHDHRGEVPPSLHATPVDSSFGAPAASVNMHTARSSMPEFPPANVSTSLHSSQTPSPSTDISIQDILRELDAPKPACPEARLFRSRSRSRSRLSSPPPIANRKRDWNAMERDHWSPGQEARGRRLRTTQMPPPPPPRSRSPIQHVPLSQRLSESANPHVGRSTSYSYRRKPDTYRPDESPPYDNTDRPRNQSKPLLDRFTPRTDPSRRQGHNEFVPPKRSRVAPPPSNSREGRGGALTLQERIS
ncbi:hypothetical protein M378DRAFT_161525 [Amanita muscaria Koide BX008]|uniref:Uncharacterized protein n=1 Tax=Amanita muscaria (strain Koide BX008) TaxID=946122 RepID=A0A0C2X997_AMAMK|nr:hypothetical protein M378DRAFT_161525 [Amanita muscaria Koide BX008]